MHKMPPFTDELFAMPANESVSQAGLFPRQTKDLIEQIIFFHWEASQLDLSRALPKIQAPAGVGVSAAYVPTPPGPQRAHVLGEPPHSSLSKFLN